MALLFSQGGTVAHLTNGSVSYVLEVVGGKHLAHRYFGPAIRTWRGSGRPVPRKRDYAICLDGDVAGAYADDFPFECPIRGAGHFGLPQLSVAGPDGRDTLRLAFESWEELGQKPGLPGLPSVRATPQEATTLRVTLADARLGIRVRLLYTLFDGLDVLTRSMVIENAGSADVTLLDAQSLSLRLPARKWDVLTMYGAHTREGNLSRQHLGHGILSVGSACGSSSPSHQPFLALMEPGAGQTSGQVVGMALVYSGNFVARCERDAWGNACAQMGINPSTFSWRLSPGESFSTPEAIVSHSTQGLQGMSDSFHQVILHNLMPKRYANGERPVLLNSWESMYYDVSEEKVLRQARLAKDLGMELFVLDDGWFRTENSSRCSMGDWQVNRTKLPSGISRLARAVHDLGLGFGLWFEPEAVGPGTELLRSHPSWVLHVPGVEPAIGRHEYLLDLGNPEVQAHLVAVLDSYLDNGDVDYIKWDMNRPLTDVWSAVLPPERQGEASHRYVLGLYEVLHEVGERHPQVLIEGCSSGGCRLDPGMLAFVAQNWASDNTDAADRVRIQSGLSLVYPSLALGAHVSAVPNHQTGRSTTLDTRFEVARQLNLGYELDLTELDQEELDEIAHQVAAYKDSRAWMAQSRLVLCEVPNDNYVAWATISQQRDRAIVTVFQYRYDTLMANGTLRIPGLDPTADYRVGGTDEVYGGDELEDVGLSLPLLPGDNQALGLRLYRL